MSIEDNLKKSEQRVIDDSNNVLEDTSEAVNYLIQVLKDKSFSKSAIELEAYIGNAIALRGLMERWETETKQELIKLVGEDEESFVEILPVYFLARALQNFDKRKKDEKA